MANKENESVNGGESEGDSFASQKGIAEESTKSERGVSQRTYSTSEIDREERKSTKIVTEFLTRSPVMNSLVKSLRHAPLPPYGTQAHCKDIPAQPTAPLNSDAVCKKKASNRITLSPAYYSPPVRQRPNDSSPTSRPRSRSLPSCSGAQHSMKSLSDEEDTAAKSVGCQLSDLADRLNVEMPNEECDRICLEFITLVISQVGNQMMPSEVFRQALEIIRRRNSSWTYRSVLDVLFYGRKLFSQLLINLEGEDINGLRLIDQFVDFFNAHCLPWIRSHGGWKQVLHHTKKEQSGVPSSTLNEGDGCESTGHRSVEGVDERDNASVTPTVFSSDSDDDNIEPAPPLPFPARQLSNIPEVESPPISLPSPHLPPATEEPLAPCDTENVPTLMPPVNQHEDNPTTTSNISSSTSNKLLYTTTIAVTGALKIYNKLNY